MSLGSTFVGVVFILSGMVVVVEVVADVEAALDRPDFISGSRSRIEARCPLGQHSVKVSKGQCLFLEGLECCGRTRICLSEAFVKCRSSCKICGDRRCIYEVSKDLSTVRPSHELICRILRRDTPFLCQASKLLCIDDLVPMGGAPYPCSSRTLKTESRWQDGNWWDTQSHGGDLQAPACHFQGISSTANLPIQGTD